MNALEGFLYTLLVLIVNAAVFLLTGSLLPLDNYSRLIRNKHVPVFKPKSASD